MTTIREKRATCGFSQPLPEKSTIFRRALNVGECAHEKFTLRTKRNRRKWTEMLSLCVMLDQGCCSSSYWEIDCFPPPHHPTMSLLNFPPSSKIVSQLLIGRQFFPPQPTFSFFYFPLLPLAASNKLISWLLTCGWVGGKNWCNATPARRAQVPLLEDKLKKPRYPLSVVGERSRVFTSSLIFLFFFLLLKFLKLECVTAAVLGTKSRSISTGWGNLARKVGKSSRNWVWKLAPPKLENGDHCWKREDCIFCMGLKVKLIFKFLLVKIRIKGYH